MVRIRARVEALPTSLLVGGLFAISALGRYLLAVRDPAPWIFHDELVYAELARSFAESGSFAIRGVEGTGGFSVLYPILISPAYVVYDRVPDAYNLIRAINSVLFSLTVIPVYLIARRLASRNLALLAATLSVALPTAMYTGNVMTENAFYPLVAFWALALIRALERPMLWRQVVVFVVLAIAFLTRVQAIVLVPVLLTALALVVLLDALADREGSFARRLWKSALRFWPTWGLLALGIIGVFVRQQLRGRPLRDILGAYGGITEFEYDVATISHWLLYHLAELDILLGVFSLAALIVVVLLGLRPSEDRELRIFAAVALGLATWFLAVGAAYAADPTAARIVERNVFHALVAWVARGAPRPWWAVAPAALFAATLTLALPLNSFLNGLAVHSTSGLLPIWRWRESRFSADSIDEVVFVAALVAAVAFVLIPRRFAVLLPVLVLLYYGATTRPIEGFTRGASISSYRYGIGIPPRDWIDEAVGRDANVASYWWSGLNATPFWESQFFNRSLGRAYTLGTPYDGLFATFTFTRVAPSGAIFTSDERRIRERYVMTDRGTHLDGKVVVRNRANDLVVYEVQGPLRTVERIDGRYPDDWSGDSMAYQRFACKGGRLHLAMENNPLIHPKPFELQLNVHGGELRRVQITPGRRRYRETLPLRSRDGRCVVDFRMPASSATVVNAGDLRNLGLRFTEVRYEPPR
jgi:hypothetical protein